MQPELIGLNAAVNDLDLTAANSINSAITALDTDELSESLQALANLKVDESNAQAENTRKLYSPPRADSR
ncbi:hypothetical protein C2E19_05475 [Pseudomonas sp. DTU12.3]|uniref:hypothetical protein n=1 Tax=Pseudomonas sp. DTU12.3 TaxID=2073078 RepID=UPI00101158D2|nr:hypothetical protein [Pseudomonas sp. DTU12.3]QAX83319.1 hypothetical protein C2E19_05475 [Pseudomonas sp. DTU12.3]